MKNVKLIFIMVLISSCVLTGGEVKLGVPKKLASQTGPVGPASIALSPNTFSFNLAADYTASDSSIVVDAGNNNLVKLLGLDQIDNLTTGANEDLGFEAGGLAGTEGIIFNVGNKITLDTSSNNLNELDKFWTPEYSHLVAYWKMNGAPGALLNGDIIEDEIGSVNGTVAGTGLSYAAGKMNQYISGYNNTGDDYITMGVAPTLSDFAQMTVGVWVYPTNLSATQTILGQEGGYKLELNNFPNAGSPIFYVGNGSGWDCWAKFNSPLIVNHWYYISGTYDGSTATIYVNGIQGETCSKGGTTGTPTKRLLIGGWDASPMVPGAGEPFTGAIDEVQIWNKALTLDQVQTITYKQLKKHSGTFYSRIMTGPKLLTDWTNFGVKIPYPLRAVSTSADPADYVSQTTNFSTNLIALWHLDEASYNGTAGEVVDSSSNNLNGTLKGGSVTNGRGLFNKSLTGDGNTFAAVPDNNLLDNMNKISISAWFFRGDNIATNSEKGGAIIAKRISYGVEHSYAAFIEDGYGNPADGKLCIDIDGGTADRFCSNATIPYFEWVHMVITYDGTLADPNVRVNLYLNGVLDKTAYETSTSIPNYASNLTIGALDDRPGGYFRWVGKIDEVGIWNRAFTGAEVAELYRRGANDASFQVRTCTNADCSDRTNNSGWIGPDGTQTSFFSEATNTSLTTTPYFDFSSNGSLAAWLATENKKYFQYRAILESDSTTYLPEVTEVAVGPTHYNSSKSYVTTKASSAISFATLTSFSQTLGAGVCASGGGVTYQLATGVSGWKFWDGSTWATATSESDANNATVVNTNIAAFATQFGSITANSDLNLKTILNSDGITPCEVDIVTVGGLKF